MAPKTARIEFDGDEKTVPIEEVRPGDVAVVRPGELIPVDGEVVAGHATVNQATLRGVDAGGGPGPGTMVYVATTGRAGQPARAHATNGRRLDLWSLIALVEEAEANKRGVCSGWPTASRPISLPAVALIAALDAGVAPHSDGDGGCVGGGMLLLPCVGDAHRRAGLYRVGAKRGLLIKGGIQSFWRRRMWC